jgi:hypothetical protein
VLITNDEVCEELIPASKSVPACPNPSNRPKKTLTISSYSQRYHDTERTWAELHIDELKADWKLAENGEPILKIS